jgi:hypothetical protein
MAHPKAGTAVGLFEAVKGTLEEAKIGWEWLLAFCGDNCAANMGERHSLKVLLQQVQRDLWVLGCLCHSLATVASVASKALPYSTEQVSDDEAWQGLAAWQLLAAWQGLAAWPWLAAWLGLAAWQGLAGFPWWQLQRLRPSDFSFPPSFSHHLIQLLKDVWAEFTHSTKRTEALDRLIAKMHVSWRGVRSSFMFFCHTAVVGQLLEPAPSLPQPAAELPGSACYELT